MPDLALDLQGLPQGYNFRPEWEIAPREVRAMRERGEDFVLLDCRRPAEFALARIEGAELVPLQEAAARLEDLEDYRDRKIVVYCHLGVRSLQMASILRQQGFADVLSMVGGIELWSLDIDPTVPRY
jgi:rhodanese-related sulfurtransferase